MAKSTVRFFDARIVDAVVGGDSGPRRYTRDVVRRLERNCQAAAPKKSGHLAAEIRGEPIKTSGRYRMYGEVRSHASYSTFVMWGTGEHWIPHGTAPPPRFPFITSKRNASYAAFNWERGRPAFMKLPGGPFVLTVKGQRPNNFMTRGFLKTAATSKWVITRF